MGELTLYLLLYGSIGIVIYFLSLGLVLKSGRKAPVWVHLITFILYIVFWPFLLLISIGYAFGD